MTWLKNWMNEFLDAIDYRNVQKMRAFALHSTPLTIWTMGERCAKMGFDDANDLEETLIAGLKERAKEEQ
jgi:hypothetical protein